MDADRMLESEAAVRFKNVHCDCIHAYDGLNRMTSAPKAGGGSHAYLHDAVGNFLPRLRWGGAGTWRDYGLSTVAKYSWDELGRMRAFQGSEAVGPLFGFTARDRPTRRHCIIVL